MHPDPSNPSPPCVSLRCGIENADQRWSCQKPGSRCRPNARPERSDDADGPQTPAGFRSVPNNTWSLVCVRPAPAHMAWCGRWCSRPHDSEKIPVHAPPCCPACVPCPGRSVFSVTSATARNKGRWQSLKKETIGVEPCARL